MGWDAYTKENLSKDERTAFKKASTFVIRKCGTVDGFLESGGLDCSSCARFLEEATGESVWNEYGWDKKLVKTLNETALWDDNAEKDDQWAYWSARKFLETCARLNLSIKFSY